MKTKFRNTALTLVVSCLQLLTVENGLAEESAGMSTGLVTGSKTRLVSINSAGTASGNGLSVQPTLSFNGRYVAFTSTSSDLVEKEDTNGTRDIFVRDVRAGTTTMVSTNSIGTASGNNLSDHPSLSANGRYVAFRSGASDLVPNDTNDDTDIFVRDLKTGTTSAASVNNDGILGNSSSYGAMLSANGRFVAFHSLANNLIANDTQPSVLKIFVHDLKFKATLLATINNQGEISNGDSFSPVISADGRIVAFYSQANNLAANDSNGIAGDVFVRDLKEGKTVLASINRSGAGGNGASVVPSLSADGRIIAFYSLATDLVANDTNGSTEDVFVRDLKTGTTTLASVNHAGTGSGNGASNNPVLSANGRFVAFTSNASDLVENDTNSAIDIFVRDLKIGTTRLASVNRGGTGSGNDGSSSPVLSADGRFVAFASLASDLDSNDANSVQDIFVRDFKTRKTRLMSVNTLGKAGNSDSYIPVLSANGRFGAFWSNSSDLVENDSNNAGDVFIRPTR
jgi:hypothetical protein